MLTRDILPDRVGQVLGSSDWIRIDEARVVAFAEVTDDRQPIHLETAAGEAAGFGGAVAHGFLTLSMLSAMSYEALPQVAGQRVSVNYGFDRVRFVAPVPVNARVRAHFTLGAAERRDESWEMLTLAVRVEIEGMSRPALLADWRILLSF